jgi:predicted ATPase with chaperone activity
LQQNCGKRFDTKTRSCYQVTRARTRQQARFKNDDIYANAHRKPRRIRKYCTFAGDDLYKIENVRNGAVTRFSILTDGNAIMQVVSTSPIYTLTRVFTLPR